MWRNLDEFPLIATTSRPRDEPDGATEPAPAPIRDRLGVLLPSRLIAAVPIVAHRARRQQDGLQRGVGIDAARAEEGDHLTAGQIPDPNIEGPEPPGQ